MYRENLPIRFDRNCISHQTSGKDTHLTLKLFKIACLIYQPTDLNYRGINVDRTTFVRIRRGMIDKIEDILAECDLFKDNSLYPRRYFDDLMLEDSIN